jgi:hypothetical protein
MWDGVERRRNFVAKFCTEHIKLAEDIAVVKTTVVNLDKRINGSMDTIAKYVSTSDAWRMSIVGIAATLLVTVLMQIGAFLYLWGGLSKQVDMDNARISAIEAVHPRVQSVN